MNLQTFREPFTAMGSGGEAAHRDAIGRVTLAARAFAAQLLYGQIPCTETMVPVAVAGGGVVYTTWVEYTNHSPIEPLAPVGRVLRCLASASHLALAPIRFLAPAIFAGARGGQASCLVKM